MAFLRNKDYEYLISESDLDIITGSNDAYVRSAELASQAEIESYIRHRYDVNLIFTDVLTYSDTTTFREGDLVEWTESAYNALTTYAEDDRVSSEGVIYISLQDANIDNAVTDEAYWSAIGENEGLYYARNETTGNTPNNIFSYTENSYTDKHDLIKGWDRTTDTLYFKKFDDNTVRIYASASDRTENDSTIGLFTYPESGLNLPVIVDIKPGDSDILSGSIEMQGFISDDTEWSVVGSSQWTMGDNRDQKMIQDLINIVLYRLFARINPRNIPDYRIGLRDDTISWLKLVAKGDITANLPIKSNDNSNGQNITYSSKPKFSNGDY